MPKYPSAVINEALGLTAVPFGTGDDMFIAHLPAFPDFSADPLDKKVALRQALSKLEPHAATVTSDSILQGLSPHVPIALSAIDQECKNICAIVRAAFIKPGHPAVTFAATDILNHKGISIGATMGIKNRETLAKKKQDCAKYAVVTAEATDLSSFHACLASVGPQTTSFTLVLPQTSCATSSAARSVGQTNLLGTTSPTGTTTSPSVPSSMSSCVTTGDTNMFPNYYGDFLFLESAASFASTFGSADPPIVAFDDTTKTHQRLSLPNALPHLTRLIYFSCFSHFVEIDYVGATISNESATHAIFAKFRGLTFQRYDPKTKKTTYHSPTEISQSIMNLSTSLDSSSPSAIATWPSSLAQQFVSNISTEIQSRLYKGRYTFKFIEHPQLHTFSLQLTELRRITSTAQEIHDELSDLKNLCRNTTTSFVAKHHPPPTSPDKPTNPATSITPDSHPGPPSHKPRPATFISPAERTLSQYGPAATASGDDDYPIDPFSDTQFQSRFPRSFRGCFRCGIQHPKLPSGVREECRLRNDPTTKQLFFQELFAHKPERRKYYDNKDPIQTGPDGKVIYPAPTRATTQVTFADPPSPMHGKRQHRQFVQMVKSFQTLSTLPEQVIPVSISDKLPTIDLLLGNPSSPSPHSLPCLLDTCAGLNSGLYSYHKNLAQLFPSCVESFIEFDDPRTPFDPIRLTGAVTDPDDYANAQSHGILRAVVSYFVPYIGTDGSTVSIRIALGDTVSVNTILGWPFIYGVQGLIDSLSSTFVARHLDNLSFPITLREPAYDPTPPTTLVATSNRLTIDNRPAWQSRLAPIPTPPTAQPPSNTLDTFLASTQSSINPIQLLPHGSPSL